MRLWRGRNRISPCRSQPEGAATRGAHLPRTRLSELTGRRRAQMLRRKTRRSGRSGQGNACEEQAQGNGETPVRVMRRRTQARLGGGIPPTKYRTADGGCSTREESSFSPEGATSMRRLGPAPEGAMRGFVSGRSRAEPSRVRRFRRPSPHSAYSIRRVGRRTPESAALARRARLPETKPHVDRQTSTRQHRTVSEHQSRSRQNSRASAVRIKKSAAADAPRPVFHPL